MADESQYASDLTNKRKYEDSPPPRRMTGFSSQPDSGAPPSYNTVPPPMSEIEIAKQKAQAIAAKLLNNSDPTKRARVENGGSVGGGGGYEATDTGFAPKPLGVYGMSAPPQVSSYGGGYGMGGPSKKIDIPNGRVGVIIGKGGETIKYLQMQSGAKIQVTRDMDADPNSATRAVELTGTPDQIAKAEQLITEVLSEAETGGSGVVSRRVTGQPSGGEPFVMMIPNNKVGLVIGKGGETIKSMQAKTGARIQVIPLHLPPGDMSKERTVQIDGTSEQIEAAKLLVNEVTSENRMRNPSMSGGYPQQGYQSQPPTNWAQPGPPMQQPGYGYVQPGAYPGPPQYNQPPYPGYPPQPASGGYTSSGWDQSTAPQNQQGQTGGYDYYNQQQSSQQQPQPDAASNYGYGQPPAAYSQGQGYGQDGYGNYQAAGGNGQTGYPESQSNTGYDQSQQGGYNSATYGTTTNPTPDPSYSTPQGENTNQAPPASGQSYSAASGDPTANPSYAPPSSQPSYGAPPSSQAGYGYGSYGPPQTQKPPSGQPAYAQPQQSPSAAGQGGAGAYGGYPPPVQTAPPSSGYPATQPGYGAPPAAYGAYGQQPAPYAGSYGSGGYPAPATYASADGSNGGNARGSYDATPPQSAATTGAAKASPKS